MLSFHGRSVRLCDGITRREVLRVGVREVRVDARDLDVRRARGGLEQRARAVVVRADPLHAGVDLEVHGRGDTHVLRDRVDLLELVDGRRGQGEAMAQEDRDLVAEDAAGKVWLSWNDPVYLQERHGFPKEFLGNLAAAGVLASTLAEPA